MVLSLSELHDCLEFDPSNMWEYLFSVLSAKALSGKSSACTPLGEETTILGMVVPLREEG